MSAAWALYQVLAMLRKPEANVSVSMLAPFVPNMTVCRKFVE